MLKKTVICVFALLVGLTATVLAQRPDKTQLPPLPKHHRYGPVVEEFVPGEILVKFRQNFTSRDRVKFNSQVQAQAQSRQEAVAAFHAHYKTLQKGADIGKWQLLKLPSGQGVKAAVTEFGKNALVENVEPNGYVYAAALSTTYTPNGAFNDPYYTDGFSLWWMDRIWGDEAKNTGYFFSELSEVIVAVLDTGVDNDHPEFTGRLVAGWNYVGGNSNTDDDNIWFGPIQIQGHGTHAAGLIVATVNNASQIAGTAWDTRVKVMPIKVLDSAAGGTVANIANGILYAEDHGAHIINMSFVTPTDWATIHSAVTTADSMGVMMIAAAGNTNENLQSAPNYPACYPEVLCVGATDAEDFVTYYSNWSDPAGLVDCVAPGGALDIYHPAFPEDNGVTSTARTGGVSAVDGTSFACPQVAGLAALLKLQVSTRTSSDIKTLILNGCELTGGGDPRAMGSGRINMVNSLNVNPLTPTITPTSTVTPTRTPTPTITVTYTITPTFTHSPTITETSTISPTFTTTPTSTATPTITVTSTVVPLAYASDEFQAYPQPGRDRVRLAYRFSGAGQVSIELYNAGGERVLHVDDQPVDRGEYAFTDVITQDLGTGVYYIKMKIEDAAGVRVITGKIAVVH